MVGFRTTGRDTWCYENCGFLVYVSYLILHSVTYLREAE
jgi:hypothetical protein